MSSAKDRKVPMSQTRSLWRQVSHFRGDCAENRYWSVRLPVKWARPILGTCRTPTLAPTLRSSRILDDGRTEMNAGCIHEFWVRRAREGAQLSGGCCFGCAWHLAVARISMSAAQKPSTIVQPTRHRQRSALEPQRVGGGMTGRTMSVEPWPIPRRATQRPGYHPASAAKRAKNSSS